MAVGARAEDVKIEEADIREKVEHGIHAESEADREDIEVSVWGCSVTLRGNVDASWKKQRAEEAARASSGVCQVTNELVVVPSQAYRDLLIADSMTAALEQDLDDDVSTIDVRVDGGRVALSGTVSSLLAFRIAQRIAESIPGVVEVDNDLELR